MKYFDTHCDTQEYIVKGESILSRKGSVSLEKAAAFEEYRQVFAFYSGLPPREDDRLWETLCQNEAIFKKACPTLAYLDRDGFSPSPLCIYAIEGCEQLPHTENPGKVAFEKGFRIFGLTWNFDNRFAGCAAQSGTGLTPEGRSLVTDLGKLGGVIDVSHLSERAFFDLCDFHTPFFASHSNAKALCDHRRNLNDRQLRVLRDRHSVVGVNFYTVFLTGKSKATVEDVCDHIIYLSDALGEEGVGLGADFDGCDHLPEGLSGIDGIACLADALLARGLSARHVNGILHDNMYSFFNANLKGVNP